jgi:putative ABC transport system permease protein
MRVLDVKLVRDLGRMIGPVIAISLVMASGVATVVMSLSTLASLDATQSDYYERYRFADIFARLKRAPQSLAVRAAEIPGVARVQTRVVRDVTLDIAGLVEPAVGRMISIPDHPAPGLNDLHIRTGRYIAFGSDHEVLVSEAFALANRLTMGSRITAILNGRRQGLRVVGTALSPEYVYPIRPGEFIPDDRRFGVIWMSQSALAAAFDMQGAFNDITLQLRPGASELAVIQQIDRIVEPYGGLGAHGRADQSSHHFVANEMAQLRGMASLPPAIFLSVTAFLLHVVFSRLVTTQREQIAVLKAFGYSYWDVGLHFAKFLSVFVVLGAALGIAAGAAMGHQMTHIYTRFFRFPEFHYTLDARVIGIAVGVAGLAVALGGFLAVSRAVRLPPAEAMRPPSPQRYRPLLLECLGLQQFLPIPLRMIGRQVEREPVKALLSTVGIALALAVLVLGHCVEDALEYVIDFQFSRVQRYDVMVTFAEPASTRSLHSIGKLPGVARTEPYRAVPVRLKSGHRSRRLAVLGLPADGSLFRLIDAQGNAMQLSDDGMTISAKLAEVLHCRIGDRVCMEVLEGERPVREVPITGIITDFTDPAAYMRLPALRRMMRDADSISGAFLTADESEWTQLCGELKVTPRVASVSVKKAALESFRRTLAENIQRVRSFNILFAGIIAFGVIFNSARIALVERGRDLATLRVMGFTHAEIAAILLGELAVQTLAAIPVGLLLGYAFAALLMTAIETETQRFPLVVSLRTYVFAVTVTLAAAVVSGWAVYRRLARLDLVAVLKSQA